MTCTVCNTTGMTGSTQMVLVMICKALYDIITCTVCNTTGMTGSTHVDGTSLCIIPTVIYNYD